MMVNDVMINDGLNINWLVVLIPTPLKNDEVSESQLG